MLFRLENRSSGQATHTGVLEFIAEEGMVYVPYWVCFSSAPRAFQAMNNEAQTLNLGPCKQSQQL